ncbi:MAG: sugar ABC transporter substrate-binding protein [Alicyclobacillus sp.]|nr:sugar ABC transporter substrate-binding protein [Alicyclobacillus sp.]
MKKALVATSVASLVVLTSACGSPNTSGSHNGNASVASGAKTVITLWWPNTPGSTDPDAVEAYKVLSMWNKAHPNMPVQAVSMPYNEILTKVTAASAAGNLPDVVMGLEEWVTQFYNMGILPDITPQVRSWEGYNHISKNIWQAVTVNGKIVAMPNYVNVRALLYHKNLLRKAGILQPPKTWAQLIADGEKLKAKGIIPFGIATDPARGPQELIAYLWQSGTDIVEKMSDGKYKNTWAQNPSQLRDATQAFQFYKDLLEKGVITKDEYNWSYLQEDQNFALGKVAMVQDGPWMETYQKQDPSTMNDVGIASIPYNKVPAAYLEVAPYFTFSKSPHEKQALEFLEFLDSKQVQSMGNPSETVRNDISSSDAWSKGFKALYSQGRSWPNVDLGQIEQDMSSAVQYVLLGQKTPQQAALWLSNQVNADLKADGELSSSSKPAQ